MSRAAFLTLSLWLALACAGVGCKKPEPPRLTPKEVSVVAVSAAGLDLLLKIEAVNPNGVTLTAQSFSGKAKLDGRIELGTVTVSKAIVLPPNTPTTLDVPMKLPWSDAMALASLATVDHPIPYVVDGTVAIGGESIHFDVPVSISGTITREQIANAALKGLPLLPFK